MKYCKDCRFEIVCNIVTRNETQCIIYEPSIYKKIKDYIKQVIQQLKHKRTTEELDGRQSFKTIQV